MQHKRQLRRSILTILTVSIAVLIAGCSSKPAETASGLPSFDSTATDSPQYPSPETWEAAGERQGQRAARSFEKLRQRDVPVYTGPLFVADDDVANLQSAQEVAKRTLVLWAVELRAEGIPQKEATELIEQMGLWDSVSPEEKKFLKDANPDPEESRQLVWRLESIWVLLWALGYIGDLEWPSGMCDVPRLVEILKPLESNPDFIIGAKLRSKAEILDAQDLIMRIHWAIRDAYLHDNAMIPEDLDWSHDHEPVPIDTSPAAGVVEQRHYVLNWLVNYPDPQDWDDVDTPT